MRRPSPERAQEAEEGEARDGVDDEGEQADGDHEEVELAAAASKCTRGPARGSTQEGLGGQAVMESQWRLRGSRTGCFEHARAGRRTRGPARASAHTREGRLAESQWRSRGSRTGCFEHEGSKHMRTSSSRDPLPTPTPPIRSGVPRMWAAGRHLQGLAAKGQNQFAKRFSASSAAKRAAARGVGGSAPTRRGHWSARASVWPPLCANLIKSICKSPKIRPFII